MQEANLYNLFLSRLNQAGFDYMVTGSVAGILYGTPRMTHDIDLVLNLTVSQADDLAVMFPPATFYCPPVEVIRAESRRETRGHFNLIHHDSGFKADVYPVGNEALIQWGMAHKKKYQLSDQVIWVAPPEYVIVQKLHYFQEGGSSKHLTDIRGILEASGPMLDEGVLQEWIAAGSLQAEWKKVSQ